MKTKIRLIVLAALLPLAAQSEEPYVPEELQAWQAWVLQGEEFRECPFYFNRAGKQRQDFACAWPGSLDLAITAQGGRFSQQWSVYADDQWIALPGEHNHWPYAVSANGRPVEVIERSGSPSVKLGTGSYRIEGRFAWDDRPGVLSTPPQTGLVALTVDGTRVERPEINRGGVFLGERKQQTKARDAVRTEIYRIVVDDVPTRLATRLQIDVSGGVREELFGPVLPAGFVPMVLNSDLPARLEADGKLRVQVRPGQWSIALAARAPDVLDEIVLSDPGSNMLGTEIWSYAANEVLRVTAAEGLPPVDPSQVMVPGEWQELPAYRIEAGQSFRIIERSRGIVSADNQLTLDRTMWLDYDGGGFVVSDSIGGSMRTGWRLDMAPPYALLSASEGGDNLLITTGAEEGETGVEVRQTELSLDAIGRSNTRGSMPITGWHERFANVTTELNLPPGHKLFAAPGADRARGSWLSQWQLLDYFLVLVITIGSWKLFGRPAGIVALLAMVLSYQELGAPSWLWINLLIAVALLRVAPAGRLRTSVLVYQGLSALALVVTLVPFVAGQLRVAIYPQLEPQFGDYLYDTVARAPAEADKASYNRMAPSSRIQAESPESAEIEEFVVTAQKSARRAYARYAPNAIVQAGPGIPAWKWNNYKLSWSGPIDADQQVRLMILPRWLVTLIRFVEVGLLLLFSAVIAGEMLGRKWKLTGGLAPRAASASVLIMAGTLAMLMLASAPAVAQSPDPALLQELKSRLTAPPDCIPRCAEIVAADIVAGPEEIAVSLTVHAAEEVAVPLPGSTAGWRPEVVLVDGAGSAQVLRGPNQQLWLRVTPGRHSVSLRGAVPAVDNLEIPFPTPPRFVTANSDHWLISGIKDRRLLTGSLQLTRLQTDEGVDDRVRWESSRFPVFVTVERTVSLDLDWHVTTNVQREAPEQGALTLDLPLLPGETVLSEDLTAENGRILVSMAPNQRSASWRSNLPRKSPLELTAEEGAAWKEIWRIGAGSIWHAEFSGVPESESANTNGNARVAEFHPRGGETLTMAATRPDASVGSTLAFDAVHIESTIGGRSTNVAMGLDYRSTSGSQHVVTLPSQAEVTRVLIDGQGQPLRAENGQLTLPVLPGKHHIAIEWRQAGPAGWRSRTPLVDIGAASSNIHLQMQLPADRWLLATSGPRLGPGVLYWAELVALVLFAVILGRTALAPLKTWHWLLLGLGFSMFSWPALAWVVVWLLACGVRERWQVDVNWWRFNLIQGGIVVLTLIALAAIVTSLPAGLLGSPDMHVVGNGSFGNTLRWFADRSDSTVPLAHAISVPLWIYKALILVWALWLSLALLRWLPWVWQCFSSQGFWRSRKGDALHTSAGPD